MTFEFYKDHTIEHICGSDPMFVFDSFFVHPYDVVNYIEAHTAELWKAKEKPSWNGKKFEDRRHKIKNAEINDIYSFFKTLNGQPPEGPANQLVLTNKFTMLDTEWNNYHDNVWHPHIDSGWNGIVFLNENDNVSGTNLYQRVNNVLEPNPLGKDPLPEHLMPWRPKENYNIIHHLPCKFNRLYLFNGNKYLHGMNIADDRYSDGNYRLNMVFFQAP